MREQDGPLVANPFMEIDWALGGLGLEIWCGIVDAQGHDCSFNDWHGGINIVPRRHYQSNMF
jgi:hypothetical protein